MNSSTAGQLFIFFLVAMALIGASLQLGGQFDFIAEANQAIN